MRLAWGLSIVNDPGFWVALSSLTSIAVASNDCAASTWQPGQYKRDVTSTSSRLTSSTGSSTGLFSSTVNTATSLPTVIISPLVSSGDVSVGQINCRYAANTEGMDINYYTCTELAQDYGIDVAKFFKLNPTVLPDCSNIKANTDYCVAGFIEPLRSNNGLCGPLHSNATCLGTTMQCCNSNTWTCGNSTADCADGTCYEGACAGDSVFSTTGQCGTQNGNKQCAGVWGDCCNAAGKCGTGADFCGTNVCQSGNCTIPRAPGGIPSWWGGNTTDGTCGPSNHNTCNVIWGNCCNANGMCGSDASDCGQGCQPLYGNCTSPGTTSVPVNLPTTTRSSTTTTTSPPTTTRSSTTTSSSQQTSKQSPTTTTRSPTTSTSSAKTTAFSALPSCGQTCFNNMQAQYSTLGCAKADSYCLCNNPNFGNGLRDCANGACGTAVGSTAIAYGSAYCSTAFATHTATTTGLAALPSCGQTCFNNMQAQYSTLGCAKADSYCLCKNANFGNGLRDCANAACGTAVASSVIAYGNAYCSTASATHTVTSTSLAALPSCGQTCLNNMKAQYSTLGCSSPDPACLCKNVNFGYGLRDCANGACGTAVASTVIAYGSSYCASATAKA